MKYKCYIWDIKEYGDHFSLKEAIRLVQSEEYFEIELPECKNNSKLQFIKREDKIYEIYNPSFMYDESLNIISMIVWDIDNYEGITKLR